MSVYIQASRERIVRISAAGKMLGWERLDR